VKIIAGQFRPVLPDQPNEKTPLHFFKIWRAIFRGRKRRQPIAQPATDQVARIPLVEDRGEAEIQWSAADLDRCYVQWLLDLDAFTEQPSNESETHALDSFTQMATGQTASAHLVPRLPTVIPQLMQSLKDEKMTGAQLARQISRDPVLVGEVIRLANSPYYRRSHKIASIEQAVVLVGQNGLRQLIARVAFYPILNLRSGSMTKRAGSKIWSQSEKCALVGRCLAEQRKEDVFSAYLAGLVSNVGMMVGLHLMDQLLSTKEEGIPRSWDFYHRFIHQAARFSHRIVEEWSFPETVALAIGELAERDSNEAISPLGKILSLSDRYSKISVLQEHRRVPAEIDLAAATADPCYAQISLW
jgi:HD-like signal output (HDOD) protein